jgi:hypothetical protein
VTINDIELEDHHRIVRRLEGELDRLMREGQYGSLEDAYALIENQARLARRRVRRLANERV